VVQEVIEFMEFLQKSAKRAIFWQIGEKNEEKELWK